MYPSLHEIVMLADDFAPIVRSPDDRGQFVRRHDDSAQAVFAMLRRRDEYRGRNDGHAPSVDRRMRPTSLTICGLRSTFIDSRKPA